jgi:hypothetical protein|tara:strand:- start:8639 stop:9085 length:447 start_codon:yes stop_codon:yes gene_type:complete
VANFTIDSDIEAIEPDIKNYGIQDYSDLHALSSADVRRDISIEWWPRANFGRYDLTTGSTASMNEDLLVDAQWTRAAVYHVLGHYIYPRLSTFSPEGDVFREKMAYYRQEYKIEFDKILQAGVKYDYDSSGDISEAEKKPTHFNRLVR